MTTNTLLGFLVDETAAQAVIFPASSMVEAKLLVLALHDVEILGHNLDADDDVCAMNERPGQRRTGISGGCWWAYTQILILTNSAPEMALVPGWDLDPVHLDALIVGQALVRHGRRRIERQENDLHSTVTQGRGHRDELRRVFMNLADGLHRHSQGWLLKPSEGAG